MEGAQAKALYGLTINYKALAALVETLLERDTLTGDQVPRISAPQCRDTHLHTCTVT